MSGSDPTIPSGPYRSCRLYAAGHNVRPFRHWHRIVSSDLHSVEELESDGPDTLILVIGRTLDLEDAPDTPVTRRTLRFCTHAADALLAGFRDGTWHLEFHRPSYEIWASVGGQHPRFPLADPYRYQQCDQLVPSPDDPESAIELPYLKEREQITREVTWATSVTLKWRGGKPYLEPTSDG